MTTALLTRNFDKLKATVEEHVAADALIQGEYWKDGKSCFIGVLANADDPEANERDYGLPVMVQRIAESIHERLPGGKKKAFFAALPGAVECNGKDLTRVGWGFLAAELRALPPGSSEVQQVINPVIDIMDRLGGAGEWVAYADARAAAYTDAAAAAFDAALAAAFSARADAAARAAAFSARAAAYAAADAAAFSARAAVDAAAFSARSAAYAAAFSARAAAAAAAAADASDIAAYLAAVERQRDTLLRIIKEAPVAIAEAE